MKRALSATAIILFLLVFLAGIACAEGIGVEVFGGLASEPTGDFGLGGGAGAGVNIDFLKVVKVKSAKAERIGRNIKFRADLSHFRWEDDVQGIDIDYVRTPLFLGGRYHYYVSPTFSFFGEAGLEITHDKEESVTCPGGVCRSDDDTKTRIGPSIGAGFRFDINKQVYGSFFLRHHEVSDNYLTALFGIGFNLK